MSGDGRGWGTAGLVAVLALLLLFPVAAAATPAASHYVPQPGNRFGYYETVFLTGGTGDYLGYTESGYYNGSISIVTVAPNLTVSADYRSAGTYRNSNGVGYPWQESGSFTFSASTYQYVQGTDNQTGYVYPSVWFYVNSSTPVGGSLTLLNTGMTVESRNYAYPTLLSSTGYAATIEATGAGSYVRDDSYGIFNASYTWTAYFDPTTGYVVGYQYVEQDTNGSGDGFTMTDTLTDTSTTFSLTTAAGSSTSTGSSPDSFLLVVLIIVVVVVVILLIVGLLLRARGRSRLPRHPSVPAPGTLPSYGPPPPVSLTPRDQPQIQQVVVRETVKVPCRYCGTLIDSTATNCPNCGAPRT